MCHNYTSRVIYRDLWLNSVELMHERLEKFNNSVHILRNCPFNFNSMLDNINKVSSHNLKTLLNSPFLRLDIIIQMRSKITLSLCFDIFRKPHTILYIINICIASYHV